MRILFKPLNYYFVGGVFTSAVLYSSHLLAVTVPDAGQSIQQMRPPIEMPKIDQPLLITPSPLKESESGGAQVRITQIVIEGNQRYSQQELMAQLGEDVLNKDYDMAGIQQLANQISLYYRGQGYPFAKAYLPAQDLNAGILTIRMLEGRYGRVQAVGEQAEDNEQAQAFLKRLMPDAIIDSATLERATLLLNDQPGIVTSPVMQPGEKLGTGDLNVHVSRGKAYTGNIGVDNHGNYYTGEYRVKGSLAINGPFMLGDQITLSTLLTDYQDNAGMWFGGIGYNRPLGGDGLRVNLGYNQTYYQLGRAFRDLSAYGVVNIYTAGLSYPIVRSQRSNLTINTSVQYKDFQDDPGSRSFQEKNSVTLPISLNFDVRDSLAGGGITYGVLTWTPGELNLSKNLKNNDTNHTHGQFNKYTLEIARLQYLTQKASLYLRGSGQWSDKNLDSSEGIGIGGANGIRAYPLGEGYGNVGWLAQVELRYSLTSYLAPYLFYDVGGATANQTTYGDNAQREISGNGVGLRFQQDNWSADVLAAWPVNGGPSQDEFNVKGEPRFWANISYQY